MENKTLLQNILQASQIVGTTWPLYSFVTSNPLSGYEKLPFQEACLRAFTKTGSITFPEISFFKQAINEKLLKESQIEEILEQEKYKGSLTDFFNELNAFRKKTHLNSNHKVDQIMVKWLSVFMDEGLADWQMPDKHLGFYKAWKKLAPYDQDIELPKNEKLPQSSIEAINGLTEGLSEKAQLELFENHFAALPGWVGYIKNRIENHSAWNEKFTIEYADYLAVRMLITKYLGLDIHDGFSITKVEKKLLEIAHRCLQEVETAWQNKMIKQLECRKKGKKFKSTPNAQLVFCIDTRSELIRRNIENKGNYETYGYAGFFGIAMDYEVPFLGIIRKSCPPILASAYKVTEKGKDKQVYNKLEKKHKQSSFKAYFLKRMKNILPSAFGFVEGAGIAYGFRMIHRSFGTPKKSNSNASESLESNCKTHIYKSQTKEDLSLDEQAQIVQSAFSLMGFKDFAPLVVFTGHGSRTANNPFASSLDCGACAASPGRHNARMIAQLANKKEVQELLYQKYEISIPKETWFLGAEHNTTTDEITLFDADVPAVFKENVSQLKIDLRKAQETATAERLGENNSIQKANKKATDWSETRPEWGLAKNAGFLIGPRSLTQHTHLEGHFFLHSYDWEMDKDGSALNAILNGPMVVTQWINNHYYFSTVDNDKYGSGSKITQNIVGKFGVVQGNGGDLKTGLPLQSVKQSDEESYHQPQRLSVFVNAPKHVVSKILLNNIHLKQLLDNQWIHLLVIDPEQNNATEKYIKNCVWKDLTSISNNLITV